eukprot:21891-Lingulodinium_polyedra.AAC.1
MSDTSPPSACATAESRISGGTTRVHCSRSMFRRTPSAWSGTRFRMRMACDITVVRSPKRAQAIESSVRMAGMAPLLG